jgi:hypothetical protein
VKGSTAEKTPWANGISHLFQQQVVVLPTFLQTEENTNSAEVKVFKSFKEFQFSR